MTTVIGVLGLPGAGKTTACESIVEENAEWEILRMKDVAGKEFSRVTEQGIEGFKDNLLNDVENKEKYVPEGNFGEEIADWVDMVLNVDEAYFSRRAVDTIQRSTADYVIVDGVRSVQDGRQLRRIGEPFVPVYIHTPFSTRLNRLQERQRKGEEDIDAMYLIDRDEMELDWGVDILLDELDVVMFYNNYDNISEYTTDFNSFIQEQV